MAAGKCRLIRHALFALPLPFTISVRRSCLIDEVNVIKRGKKALINVSSSVISW